MKAILISIRPEWVAKILNGEKTIEIRKTAPKCDLPIDVYIYCTKDKNNTAVNMRMFFEGKDFVRNGKVVAKFTLKKVEKFIQGLNETEYEHLPNFALKDYDYYGLENLMKKACLNDEEISKYAPDQSFYAWHISDLEIFDEPKELDEFDYPNTTGIRYVSQRSLNGLPNKKYPPRSWCYVEEKE